MVYFATRDQQTTNGPGRHSVEDLAKSTEVSSEAVYVQYGCGFAAGAGWHNFDRSPTMRIERLPIIGAALGRLSGNRQQFPDDVRYGDICKGLPIADGTVKGVYASHVLEHLSYEDCLKALRNTYAMLEPGGAFRLIVPDLHERARRYLHDVENGSAEANSVFLRTAHLGREKPPKSWLDLLRMFIGGTDHLWMWDEASMSEQLMAAGFTNVRRCEFGDSGDPMFARVEDITRFIDPGLDMTELALAASKPAL